MQRRTFWINGALLGGLTSLPLLALFYLGNRWLSLPFVPFDVFDWLTRMLPGNVITAGIDLLVRVVRGFGLGATDRTAKQIEQLLALGLFVLGGLVLGALLAWVVAKRPTRGQQRGAIVGLLVFVLVAAIELVFGIAGNLALALAWPALLFVAWGALLGRVFAQLRRARQASTGQGPSRRAVLAQLLGGSAAVTLAAWGLGRFLAQQRAASGAGQSLAQFLSTPTQAAPTTTSSMTPTATAPITTPASQRLTPAPGTHPEITDNPAFYRIDINLNPPVIKGATWVLEVAGLFDQARPLTLADFMQLPAVTQAITIGCISNPVGGDLISASRWTGVRLRDLLKMLGLRSTAKELAINSVDGFYESVTMTDMLDPRTLLVYGMNGKTLPVEHGFPLRIYIPNRYGMKQPKWITRIEAIDHHGPGYWVERGWSATAHPQTLSIIDTVAQNAITDDNKVPIGGIAWAGDRGIQQVEVQVDDDAWQTAQLRTPPLSGLMWVQWRYDWPLVKGKHTFRVRATDGTGAVQTAKQTPPHPNGATGYATLTATL